jgi:hypothetical protein
VFESSDRVGHDGNSPAVDRVVIMRRTPAELRLLTDCAQLVLLVAGLVVLALPWWLVFGINGPDGHLSGWAGLSKNPHNQGLTLVAALVIGTVTTALRRRLLAIIAAVLFVLGALLTGIGAHRAETSSTGNGDVLAATWVGIVLVLLAAVQQLGVAALARSADGLREG